FGDGSGGGAVEVDEDETVPDFGAEGAQVPLVAIETFGLSHFRAGLEFAVEFESPEVIGTEKKAGVAATGFTILCFGRAAFGRAVAVVSETGRHDVHGAVRADTREHVDAVFFIADNH